MSSPPVPKSPEDQIRERIERRRSASRLPDVLSSTPELVRVALAVLPTATREILASLSTDAPIDAALEALTAEGLIDADPGALASTSWALRTQSGGPAPGLRPSASLRQRILEVFMRSYGDPSRGAHALLDACRDVAQALESRSDLPETTRRWVHLATDPGGAAARLDTAAAAAADRHDSADVSRWVDAALPLAVFLERDKDMSLTLAVERAGRRLELLHRERADDRHLDTFFRRREQIDALDAFLTARGGNGWMLHLLGSGGVGKTMLIRHLMADMAKARGCVSARVDFDFLSPDYPRLDPGLLLWSLGRELQLRTGNEEAVRAFRDAEGQFRHLSDVLRSARTSGGDDAERPTRHPLFIEATAQFVSAMRLTCGPSLETPIVLVLDTCEELVKGRSRGGPADAVVETFRILSALRHGVRAVESEIVTPGDPVTNLRVVFAGRRPLACEGEGWTADSDLPPRPGLQVFELRGFSGAEAEEWLGRKLEVPVGLIPAVIAATPDMDLGARVTWRDGRPPQEVGKNPYDLKHFAEWAKEVPPPSPAVLASGSTRQYVEQRILSKLEHPDLARFLVALSVVRHADRALLEALVDVDRFGEGLDVLTAHEWIARRVVSEPDGRPRVIYQLEERLRRRLRRYFGESGVDLAAVGARAASWLHAFTLERDLAFVEVDDVDAALRAFELEPDAGRAWWRAFVDRVITQRDFNALLRYTDFLLGDEQAAGPRKAQDGPEHPLRVQVMGDQAAALARTGALEASDRGWRAVSELLAGRKLGPGEYFFDPTTAPKRHEVLAIRSLMGQIAASAERLVGSLDAALEAWAEAATRPQPAPEDFVAIRVASVAALEALAERAETIGVATAHSSRDGSLFFSWPNRLSTLATTEASPVPRELRLVAAMFCLSIGRMFTCLGRSAAAHPWFESARVGVSAAMSQSEPLPALLDWTPPANPVARVLLEGLRHGAPFDVDAIRLEHIDRSIELSLYDKAAPDADRDRLWAWLLLDQASKGFPDPESPAGRSFANQLAFAQQLPMAGAAVGGRSLVNAHRLIPPLVVVGTRLACERGELSKGIPPLLRAASDWALDYNVRLHISRALLDIGVLLRRPISDRGVDDPRSVEFAWAIARARFVCEPLAGGGPAPSLRRQVEDEDLLAGFVRPADEGPAADRLPLRERWRLTPGRVSAACGPLADWRRAARIEEVAAELLGPRENARSLFDAGDIVAFIDRDAGIRLLERAVTLFEKSGDRVGQFAALARLCLLAATGDTATAEDLQSALDRCQPAHDALAEPDNPHATVPWRDIEEGATLITSPGFLPYWRFRLGLCFVRLRELRREPPKRESFFRQRNEVYLRDGRLADVLQLLGRDPWSGDLGDDETPTPKWQESLTWRVVKNWPAMRRLIAALIRVAASFVESWIQFSTRVNPRTSDAASPKETLLRRLEAIAALVDAPPDTPADESSAAPRAPASSDSTPTSTDVSPASPIAARRPPAPAEAPAIAEQPQPSPPQPKAPWSNYVALVVGWAMLGGLVTGGFLAVRPLIRWLLQRSTGNPAPAVASWTRLLAEVGVYAILAVAFLFVVGLFSGWVTSGRRRRSRLLLKLSSPDTTTLSGQIAVEGAIAHSRFPFGGMRFYAFEAWRPWTIDLLSGAMESERQELGMFLNSLGSPTPRVEISASGPLARRAPWETLLARYLGVELSRLRISHRGLAPSLMGPSRPRLDVNTYSPRLTVVLLTAHESSGRFADEAWRAQKVDVWKPPVPNQTEESEVPPSWEVRSRVAHLIGEVENRGADVRWRSGAGVSFGAGQIEEMLDRPALIVLQGPLRPQLAQREDSDRLEAAARRDLAYRLHDTGVPLVLVLPRFDPPLMETVLARVVGAARAARGVDPWLDVVTAIRAAIITHCGDTSDGRELAGDVCLFAGDWNERVVL